MVNVLIGVRSSRTSNRCRLASPWDAVGFDDRPHRRVTDCHATDSPGRSHVPLEQSWRDRQHLRDVVESIAGVVCRQHRAAVDVERQQIADRIGVLGAVQTMDRGVPRVGMFACRASQFPIEPFNECRRSRRVGPAGAERRHGSRGDLLQYFFPEVRLVANARDVSLLEDQIRGTQPCVVTCDAVPIENRPGFN